MLLGMKRGSALPRGCVSPGPRVVGLRGAAESWLNCLAAAPSGADRPLMSTSLCFAVIRAKVVSEKEVGSGDDVYGNPIKRIQYEIKQIKVRAAGGSCRGQ